MDLGREVQGSDAPILISGFRFQGSGFRVQVTSLRFWDHYNSSFRFYSLAFRWLSPVVHPTLWHTEGSKRGIVHSRGSTLGNGRPKEVELGVCGDEAEVDAQALDLGFTIQVS